jgi:hypothetical protein
MPSFRRAQLRGSDELFQPTRTDNGEPPSLRPSPASGPDAASTVTVPAPSRAPEGRLVRLTDEEVQTLAEAVQRLKFPGHGAGSSKPPLEEFERLEELRQKLLSVL